MFKRNWLMYDDAAAGAGNGEPAGNGGGQPPTSAAAPKFNSFEEFIKTQPPELQDLYTTDVHGLKTALEKERKAKAPAIEPEKLKAFEEWQKTQNPENDPMVLLENLKAEKEALSQRYAQRDAEYREVLKERAFDDSMVELDLWFVNEAAQNDAYQILEQYKLGEKFENMQDSIKQLLKERPHLFLAPKKEDEEDTGKTGAKGGKAAEAANKKQRVKTLGQRFRI
jgi:hypothetical protein